MVRTERFTQTVANENCRSSQYDQVKSKAKRKKNLSLLGFIHFNRVYSFLVNRCSSCGLRHPRKPTGRPHYAARQCNQCKIRHTAREVRFKKAILFRERKKICFQNNYARNSILNLLIKRKHCKM